GMRGEISFIESYEQRMGLLKNLPLSGLFYVLNELVVSKGAETVINTMKHHGAKAVLLSGGFDFFTERMAERLGFDAHFGNHLKIHGDVMTGEIVHPILDRDAKRRIVQEQCEHFKIPQAQAITIG